VVLDLASHLSTYRFSGCPRRALAGALADSMPVDFLVECAPSKNGHPESPLALNAFREGRLLRSEGSAWMSTKLHSSQTRREATEHPVFEKWRPGSSSFANSFTRSASCFCSSSSARTAWRARAALAQNVFLIRGAPQSLLPHADANSLQIVRVESLSVFSWRICVSVSTPPSSAVLRSSHSRR
jgi:hypothetical protein